MFHHLKKSLIYNTKNQKHIRNFKAKSIFILCTYFDKPDNVT